MRFLDLSGYAFTGKHAVIDLMREMRGYHVEHFAYEFALLRVQGGIHDLEHALVGDWSPIRSDAEIRRFKRNVERYGSVNDWFRPATWFTAVGWNYEAHYRGQFFALSDAYLRRLVSASWTADWPYALADLGPVELFARKIAAKLRIKNALGFEMTLSRPASFAEFRDATRDYLEALLTSNVAPDTRTVVLHNAFEGFDPAKSIRYFDDARAIVIDRDPRDNYVQGLWYQPTAVDVETFIRRYRLYRDATNYAPDDRVLRMKFEDLILDYEATVSRILAFLGEDASVHVKPRAHFNPDVSKKNVGAFRAHADQAAISRISAALPEFCDPRL
jgi:hypothetical protein